MMSLDRETGRGKPRPFLYAHPIFQKWHADLEFIIVLCGWFGFLSLSTNRNIETNGVIL